MPRAPAFTLIELLIVIAIIILLTAILIGVGTSVVESQKTTVTRNIMRTTGLAIEQFAQEDPLSSVYNNGRAGRLSFGPYPPYQLAGTPVFPADTVSGAIEGNPPGGGNALFDRLQRDLDSDGVGTGVTPEVVLDNGGGDHNDDIRALYAYLRVFGAASLAQVPETARKPLSDNAEYINTTGSGGNPQAAVEVLGIYDAWGVPLDYMLYVRLEWGPNGLQVKDRVPVLRSRGVKREVYDGEINTQPDSRVLMTKDNWIFSETFRSPAVDATRINDSGVVTGGTASNGWARAVAAAPGMPNNRDDYGYVPAQDK